MTASWVRRITVGSVVLVGVVAAVVSYAHISELAARSGEAWRAWLLPLSVDGMLVASTLAIVDRRRFGQPAGWVPWAGLTLGIAASLAGNVAAARPDVVSQIVAAWPPLALAVSIETMVVVLRRGTAQTRTEPAVSAVERPAEDSEGDCTPDPVPVVATPDPVAELLEQGAGRRRLARELGVTEHQARQLLADRNGVAR